VSLTIHYLVSVLFWVILMAALGLAARPIINRLGKEREDR
jgi:hypothetical protein